MTALEQQLAKALRLARPYIVGEGDYTRATMILTLRKVDSAIGISDGLIENATLDAVTLEYLIAAGFLTQEKSDEARRLAKSTMRNPSLAADQGSDNWRVGDRVEWSPPGSAHKFKGTIERPLYVAFDERTHRRFDVSELKQLRKLEKIP